MNNTLIEQFSELKTKDRAAEFYNTFLDIMSNALSDIADELNLDPNGMRLFAIGDYTNDTYIDESGEIEVVLADSDPQRILANRTFLKQYAEQKSKKQRDKLNLKNTSDELVNRVFKALVPYFSEETTLVLTGDGIKVLCKKEYDFNVLLRIGTFDLNDKSLKISFWNVITKSELVFDVFGYHEAMDKKDKKTKGNYKKVVRVLKNLRKTMLLNKWIVASQYNRYFVDMLAYNIPDKLLTGNNFVDIYYKSILYLTNCDLQSFKDFDGNSLIYNKLANTNYGKIKKFVTSANQILEQ